MARVRTLTVALVAAALMATAAPAVTARAGTSLSFPPPVSVSAVAFPGGGSGWALGTEGQATVIWHGGVSWQAQWRGTGTPLALTATDAAHAWALLGRRLIATADGGAYWRQVGTLPGQAGTVRFASARLGVATVLAQCSPDATARHCPGRLLVSRDGGAHWTTVLASGGPLWATASASGTLWAARTAAGGPATLQFLTSADGGRSWRPVGTLDAFGAAPFSAQAQVTLAAGPSGLAAVSVFDVETCSMHGCGVATIYQSRDRGRSWQQAALPASYPDECGPAGVALSLAADGTLWAATGRNGAACAPPYGVMFRASGMRWQALAPWQLATVTTLDAVSARVAYAIGDQGTLSGSTDGGQHWTQLLPGPVPAGALAAAGPAQVAGGAAAGFLAIGGQDVSDAGAILLGGPQGWRQAGDLPGVVTWTGFAGRAAYAVTYTPGGGTPWRLWTLAGSAWTAVGALPAGPDTVIAGPWLTADGHGLLLSYPGGSPWQPQAGGEGPVTEWLTADGGRGWQRNGLLPIGRDSLAGPATFAYRPGTGWAGWVAAMTPAGDTRNLVIGGNRATAIAGIPAADGLRLTAPGTGFAWTVSYSGPSATLTLYRTTDNGGHWRHSTLPLPGGQSAVPLIAFADADHGWLVSGQVTVYTADGGQTWVLNEPSGSA